MSKEILEAQVVYSSDQSSLKKLQLESEAVLKRLKDPIAIELTAKLGNLKQTKAELLNQISDIQKELKLQLKMEVQNPGRITELRTQLGGLRGEADMLGKVINRQNQNLNNFANTGSTELSKLGYYFQKLGIDIDSSIGKRLLGASEAMASFGAKALGIFGAGAIATGLYKIGSASLVLADNLEQNEIAFSTMLGSGEKATQLLADLSAFASKTPFELTGIRQNAKQLLAMGIASDDLIPTMKALGDVSAGLSVPLDRLALAYGQVIAKGKLQGGELKQFTEAGVPLIATMSKTLGVTQGEFYKMVEAGKISADEVVKAFQTMSGEGGQFNNLMIQQSQTMSGMWSNFKDQLALTGEAIGTALMPAMKGLIVAMSALLGFFTGEKAQAVYSFIAKLGEFLYIISGLKIAVSVLVLTFESLYNLFKAFMPVIDDIAISINTMLDTAMQLTKDFGDFFSQKMEDITGATKDSTDAQVGFWEYVTAFITVAWIHLIGFIQGTFQTLIEGLGSVMEYFTSETTYTAENMKGIFVSVASAIANTVLGIVNNIVNLMMIPINTAIFALNKLKELGNSVGGDFKKTDFITASFSVGDGKGVFQKAGGKILEGFESLGNNVTKAVEAKTQQMIDRQTKGTTAIVKNNTAQAKSYGSVADSASKGSKKGSDAAKEAADKQKKYYKDLIERRKENIKSIDTEIKKLKDGVKEIEAIEKKMQELITGAKGQTGDVVASRYRTLLEDKKSAEEALLDHQRSTDQSIYALDPAYQNNLNDINSQIAEIEQSGLLDQNTKAKEEQRASLSKTGQDRFDFQEALADIELKKSAEMESLKAEKIAVEARLGMKADEATKELALLEKRKSQNERQLKAYEDITKIIEKGITDATKQNIDARMVEYRKEEAKLNDLIRLRMMAGMAIPSPIAPVTTNNVTNAPTVNVNAQVAQNVDVNYLGQELSRQLLLSNKGIN